MRVKNLSAQNLLGWGLNLADYKDMFDLNDTDLNKTILDYHAGPSTFNSELSQQAKRIISLHPLYALPLKELSETLTEKTTQLADLIHTQAQDFAWDQYATPAALIDARQTRIDAFLADFPTGLAEGRYIDTLPPAPPHFELALLSHALFSEQQDDLDHHLATINQLIHIADEVRIFPLLDQHGQISSLVGPISLALQQQNFGVEIREVTYHLQPNDNAMLRIWPLECLLD
jgi:hypothetical protein